MSVDNRTIINDCEATDGWSGDDGVSTDTAAGAFYQDATALTWQAGVNSEQMSTTENSVGIGGTFDLDWTDACIYLLVKDNLGEGFSTGGIQSVIGDGTNITGYNVGGNDAPGIPLPTFFNGYKLDVSVVIAAPGSFTDHAGSEASLAHANITEVGIGVNHLVDAMGPSDNTTIDCIRYIANDSYALTVNGGTAISPETSADLVADDITGGWGMVSNPIGLEYRFFAPTEWGNETTIAEHAFEAENEQWFWMGDNGGGHAVGTDHFIFRVVANATDAGLFRLTSVVIVNTGTGADLDLSDTDIDILEIDTCSFTGLASCLCPTSGGTSRFTTNTTFIQCGTVTHNGASMNGSTIIDSIVLADESAMFYNVAADPNTVMSDMSHTKGALAHHALEFGTFAPATMTLTNWTVTDFNALDNQDDSVFLFPDTGSDVDWVVNIIDGTGTFSFKKVRIGDTVDIAVSVTVTVTAFDSDLNPQEDISIYVQDAAGPFNDTDQIVRDLTNASGVASSGYSGSTPLSVVIRGKKKGKLPVDTVGTITGTGLTTSITIEDDPNQE